jgi:hypothetical protein
VAGTAITSTGTQIDPIVSGSNFAHLFDGAASSKIITIPTASLVGYDSACLEFYLYMAGGSTFVAAKLGADNLIEFISTGLARVTLPYASGGTQAMIDFTPDDTTQISINVGVDTWSIWVDAVLVSSGPAPAGGLKDLSNVTMTSPASGSLVFGAFLMYPKAQDRPEIQARQVEAVFFGPDAHARYDFVNYEISDLSQNFAVKYDIPKSYSWEDYLVDGIAVVDGELSLDLNVVETYNPQFNCYSTSRAYTLWGSQMGRAHVNIPSYTTSATNRGIVHLRSDVPGSDEFALRFNTGNRLELLRTVWSRDANNVDTSSVSTTLMATPGSAISAAAAVSVGFGWNPNGLYVVYGSTATLVAGTAGFNFNQYEAIFGTTRSTANGPFDQPYFTSQAAWTWEIRLWNNFDNASPTVSPTSYGNHTFFTAQYNKDLPVMGEVAIAIDVPLPEGESLRVPYLYLDSEAATVTETLV